MQAKTTSHNREAITPTLPADDGALMMILSDTRASAYALAQVLPVAMKLEKHEIRKFDGGKEESIVLFKKLMNAVIGIATRRPVMLTEKSPYWQCIDRAPMSALALCHLTASTTSTLPSTHELIHRIHTVLIQDWREIDILLRTLTINEDTYALGS